MKSPKARTAIVSIVLILLALAWEAIGLSSGEQTAWTFSRLVWSLTDSELFVFACGILAGHFFFPKTRCLHCGFLPYRVSAISREAFNRALSEFAAFVGPIPYSRSKLDEAKRQAGFPVGEDM